MSTGIALTQDMSSPNRAENRSPAPGTGSTPLPDWFEALQAEGRERFESLPMPTRRNEAWRFTNLKKLDLTPYGAAKPLPESEWRPLVERSKELEETAGRMVFVNDVLVAREVLSESLRQKGVIWKPLDQAAIDHPELFRKHFMAHGADLGSEKFAALHQASVRSGTFLYVPRGVTVDLPIEVFHWLSGENASTFPHTLLIAEANSKVTLIDYFFAADPEAAGLSIGVNDLHVADGAQLNYICLQEWSQKALAFQINNTVVAANATAKSLNVNLGGAYARTESLSKLMGEGGRSDMLSVTVANGEQEFDQRTLQDHFSPGAYSDLLYKNSLDDRARTIFAGLIKVELDAHRTDAYQKVRNLMLSDDAEANSAPGLEILADDVRCTHGATAGEIDHDELFYLAARGIGREQAQRLIVHGFLKEAINRLGDPAVADLLGRRVAKKFGVSV